MRASLEPRLLILCPLAREWSFLVSTFEASLHVERLRDLKIDAACIPDWRALVAPGGHGKTQFAVQAQYLIGRFPSVELVICAGAAGSLAPELSVGDVVVGTETVEHDYRLLFATRPLPRFPKRNLTAAFKASHDERHPRRVRLIAWRRKIEYRVDIGPVQLSKRHYA